MRQAQADRAEAQRARRLSADLLSDARARSALIEYAAELERRADALERDAKALGDGKTT